MKITKKRQKTKMEKYGLSRYFLLSMFLSFLGWALETVYIRIATEKWGDRGFMTMPFCPIYGCSLILVYFLIGTPPEGSLFLKSGERRFALFVVSAFRCIDSHCVGANRGNVFQRNRARIALGLFLQILQLPRIRLFTEYVDLGGAHLPVYAIFIFTAETFGGKIPENIDARTCALVAYCRCFQRVVEPYAMEYRDKRGGMYALNNVLLHQMKVLYRFSHFRWQRLIAKNVVKERDVTKVVPTPLADLSRIDE